MTTQRYDDLILGDPGPYRGDRASDDMVATPRTRSRWRTPLSVTLYLLVVAVTLPAWTRTALWIADRVYGWWG